MGCKNFWPFFLACPAIATANDLLKLETVSTVGIIESKTDKLFFISPLGLGVSYSTNINGSTFVQASYDMSVKNSTVLLHGPSAYLGFRIYGNTSFIQSTEVTRTVVKYPFNLNLLAGAMVRFHDFSSLQEQSVQFFNDDTKFFNSGYLYGASVALVGAMTLQGELRGHVFLSGSYAKAPQVSAEATVKSAGFGVGVGYAL